MTEPVKVGSRVVVIRGVYRGWSGVVSLISGDGGSVRVSRWSPGWFHWVDLSDIAAVDEPGEPGQDATIITFPRPEPGGYDGFTCRCGSAWFEGVACLTHALRPHGWRAQWRCVECGATYQ